MKKLFTIFVFANLFVGIFAQQDSVRNTVSGRAYPVVKIGNQIWMAENVADSVYDTQSEAYGDTLPVFRHVHEFKKEQPYCLDLRFVNATRRPSEARMMTDSLRQHLGFRYNWYGATAYKYGKDRYFSSEIESPRQGICPNGFHIPTLAEYSTLKKFVDGYAFALMDSIGWLDPKGDKSLTGDNSTGFSALPSGNHNIDALSFANIGTSARWLTATPYTNNGNTYNNYHYFQISTDTTTYEATISATSRDKSYMLFWNTSACRCVKNTESTTNLAENAQNVAIFAENHQIIIESETPQEVVCADILGRVIYKGFATIIPVNNSGIYVVKVGNKTHKVVVK